MWQRTLIPWRTYVREQGAETEAHREGQEVELAVFRVAEGAEPRALFRE